MTHNRYRSLGIVYGEEQIDFLVESSSLRTSSIRIDIDTPGGIRVIAPVGASDVLIRAAVRRRAKWIWKHYQPRKTAIKQNRAISGEEIIYLGRHYMLKVEYGTDQFVKLKGGRLVVRVQVNDPDAVMSAVNRWYRVRAKEYFGKRIASLYSSAFNQKTLPPDFDLRAMKRQWGSCSPTGKLLLNPSLIRAPSACVDYVVTHELCHLKHRNHNAAFYRLLSACMPDWKDRKAFLEMIASQILAS